MYPVHSLLTGWLPVLSMSAYVCLCHAQNRVTVNALTAEVHSGAACQHPGLMWPAGLVPQASFTSLCSLTQKGLACSKDSLHRGRYPSLIRAIGNAPLPCQNLLMRLSFRKLRRPS